MPATVNGRIGIEGDVDLFAFTARKGVDYMVETEAARRGSPADTKIALLWPDGRPVERVQLRAARNSAVTFRGTDANGTGVRLDSWEEMELNEFLQLGGEVVKLFRMPQGPDSDMIFYASNGRRRPSPAADRDRRRLERLAAWRRRLVDVAGSGACECDARRGDGD